MNCKKLLIALGLIFSIVLGMMTVNNKNVKAENEISNNMSFESSTSFTQTMVISGDVTLTISKGVKVEAKKGIRVTPGNSLTIEGEGTLVATGQANQATSKESKSQNPTKVIYPEKSHDFFNMLIKEAKAKKVRLKSVKAKKHRKVIARWKKL